MSITWRRVSRANPCPVCDKPDHCQVAEDESIVMCRRAHTMAVSGGRTKVDRSGVPYTMFGGRKSSAGVTEYTEHGPADVSEPDLVQHKYVLGEGKAPQLPPRYLHDQGRG